MSSVHSPVSYEEGVYLSRQRSYTGWLFLIYFGSGICSLIDQIIWIRLLKLVFGNTVYATSVVVSVFLGGLAVGSAIVCSVAERTKHPLKFYAVFETLITFVTLLFPILLRLADSLYVYIYRNAVLSLSWILLVQIIISSCIILVPAMLMGAGLPFLARYVSLRERHIGFSVGRLYAINMLGAAVGAFLAGFVLVRYYGVWGALYFAGGLNGMVAISAWYLARVEGEMSYQQASGNKLEGSVETVKNVRDGEWKRYLLLVCVFISGFVSIGYEIVWTRTVIPLLGGDTYVFSSILTVYLGMNMAGVWTGSKLARKVVNPVLVFALCVILVGMYGVIYIPFLGVFASRIFSSLDKLCTGFFDNFAPGWSSFSVLASSFILFSLPSLLMGIGFPLSLEGWHRGEAGRGAGYSTGLVYAVNTAGCVAGGLCAGLVMIPLIGSQYTVQVLGVAGVMCGSFLFCFYSRKTFWQICYAICPAIITAILILFTPGNLFYKKVIVYGDTKLVAVKEGPNTIVSVHRAGNGNLWLCTSGLQVAGDALKCVQRVLGHFGYLIHPSAKTVLSVGFGSGETTRCLSLHKPVRIDCVEIAPEIVEVALRYFRHRNLGDALTNHVNMIYMDAKNYLKLTERKYDLIITDSISPKAFAENASLYTREYFINARERLNEGGVILCWTPFNIPTNCFESIIGTFQEVFPYVMVWFPVISWDHFVLLAGSMKPFVIEPDKISAILKEDGIRRDLNEIKIFDVHDVLACYLGDGGDVQRWLRKNYKQNSDFSPYVEFATGKFLMPGEKWRYLHSVAKAMRSLSVTNYIRLAVLDGEYTAELFQHDLTIRYMTDDITYKLNSGYDIFLEAEHEQILKINLPDYLSRHSFYVDGHIIYGTVLNEDGRYDEAIQHLTRALELDAQNSFALNQRGFARLARGDVRQAIVDFNKAIEYAPYYYMPYYNLGIISFQMHRYEESLEFLSKAIQLRASIPSMFIQRGLTYMALKQPQEAVSDFSSAIGLKYQKIDIPYFHRAVAYFTMKDYDRAIADINEAIKVAPDKPIYYSVRSAIYCERGDYVRAWEDIQKCIQLGGKPDSNILERVRSRTGSAKPI